MGTRTASPIVLAPSPGMECRAFDERKTCTRTTSPPQLTMKRDGAESVGVRKAGSHNLPAFHAPSALAQNSFQLLEKRIEVEVKERMRLWSSLMEDLGESQATVKRLENRLEDVERLLHEQKGC